ncbi:hypothetical protein SAMN05192529_101245 [Arachidicoccus rhizosphaerae]|uniref:Uncharacterized protein n=1 Tax=Arachidicoccus rhizosphaerae TaxID=551991 RepID=A0A1H3VL43_9BACT|nr:hypothetical protein SAMN05192529_101245 [Arachidicoccus rhizosphaerae]
MKILDLFCVSIYAHYNKMKQKGRSVIPWFETCCVIALSLAITALVFTKLILSKYKNLMLFDNENTFLISFLSFCICIFFIVKRYFFNKDKHLKALEMFYGTYSDKQRNRCSFISLSILVFLPLFIYLFLYLQAVNII